MKTENRIVYLDCLRGLMALNVILCHFVRTFYPQMYNASASTGDFLSVFGNSPLNVLINGDIGVRYFFMLTGFFVSLSVIRKDFTKKERIVKLVNRYFRLLPIVCAATLFCFLTMILGLQYHHDILDSGVDVSFLRYHCDFEPSVKSLITTSFCLTFITGNKYVSPFWTMKFEFLCYILIFLACLVLKDSKWRRIVLSVSIVLVPYNCVGFLMGALVADFCYCKKETVFSRFYEKIIHKNLFVLCCFIFGLYFSCCPIQFSGIYSFWGEIGIKQIVPQFLRSLGISLVTYSFIHWTFIQKLLETPAFEFMGKISFSVYAFHWPIMLSLQCGLFKVFIDKLSYNQSALLSFFITLPVIYLVAWLSWRFIESKIKIDVGKIKNIFHYQKKPGR